MKAYFATPSYRGIQHQQFLDSLEETVLLCQKYGIRTEFNLLTGCCYVQVGRNDLVDHFLKSDADVLFFLDDDLAWPAEAVLKVLRTEGDIVAGVYPLKNDEDAYPVLVQVDAADVPVQRYDGSISVAGAPTGFMKITRQALERLKAAYPEQEFDEYKDGEKTRTLFDFFPQGVKNRRWVGEDYAFCNLWLGLGEKIWVVPDIDFTHFSTDKAYFGNLHQHLLRHTS